MTLAVEPDLVKEVITAAQKSELYFVLPADDEAGVNRTKADVGQAGTDGEQAETDAGQMKTDGEQVGTDADRSQTDGGGTESGVDRSEPYEEQAEAGAVRAEEKTTGGGEQ